MTVCIALLRSVNVGGSGRLVMADLRKMAEGLGLSEVRTVVATGNLVFESSGRSPASLETLLQTAAKNDLGLENDIIVRAAKDWIAAVAANPFPRFARADPAHLVLMAMKGTPDAGAVKAVRDGIAGREEIAAVGQHLYITYPDGIGRSKLSGALIERRLGMRGTARNWNTVVKLAEMVGA